ncbi:MAG: 3-dehydroquinate synthase [Candidatus Omnitrophica bacterium]|nr:3-dehydroquinate synthase [Candidatus Omnitrophota bacterium]
MKKIKVRLGERSYDVLIGRGLIGDCGRIIKRLRIGTDAVVITNPRVAALYKKSIEKALKRNGFTVRFELVPDSEKAKSLSTARSILNRLSRYDVNKRIFIIALGGGVVGDLAGFVASVYRRGTPYVQIPTTLLAQVDSSIGGKVAVDLSVAKNMVGSFYQPRVVISDVSAIKTLSLRQIRNGLAEIIKYGVIKDSALFKYVESNYAKILKLDMGSIEYVVFKSVGIKAGIIARDELDRRRVRAILNYGHTMGHAIEAASGYSGRYDHGEAVALGMRVAGRVARGLGLIKRSDAVKIETLIGKVGLPVAIKGIAAPKIYAAHLHDKKFTRGRNRFILAVNIGNVRIIDGIADSAVRNALRSCIDN